MSITLIKKLALPLVVTSLTLSASITHARNYIDVVGSSTVYPFSTVVAEAFGNKTGLKTPKIESTGSGGGMKLFCTGQGVNTPDITNASRRIKKGEFDGCQANGVKDIIEVQIGYDGIALANSKKAQAYQLTTKDIFLALAKQVPGKRSGKLINNPYKTWNQVNPALPNNPIEVLGPPPTSGTRDAFVELAMEGGCDRFDWIKKLSKTDKNKYKSICHTLREDGLYVEAGENDNLIVEKLRRNPKALGIFGFSFLDQNSDAVQGSSINGVVPEFETIADGDYPISRPLYFYVKKAHVGRIPGIREFLAEFTDEDTWGDDGYLLEKGLIPLAEEEREEIAYNISNLIPMRM